MRTITLTLNDMKIVPLDVFRGKITFKRDSSISQRRTTTHSSFGRIIRRRYKPLFSCCVVIVGQPCEGARHTSCCCRCPAEGRAVLSLNAEDFGNFLVHPLMSKADLPSGEFEFQKEGAVLDADNGRTTFAGMWRKQSVVMEACQPERTVREFSGTILPERALAVDNGATREVKRCKFLSNTTTLFVRVTRAQFARKETAR
ncbi:unnamed protein product [Ascophyllum nodosum]